jgi:hypothetical protein
MKKIKSIKQLRAEKKWLKERQDELEGKISSNWKELKEGLKPVNIAREAIDSFLKKKTEKNLSSDGFLKNTVAYGFSMLAKKFVDITGEKFSKTFRKDKAGENLQAYLKTGR